MHDDFPSPAIWFTHRISYGETDTMGVLYYAEYLHIFERARSEFIRACGMSYRDVEEKDIILPVREAQCRYRSPARYDDLLTFRSWVKEIKGVRMVIASEVRRGDELLVAGHVVLVSVNPERKVVRMSKELVESCEQFFWSPEDEK